MADPAAKSPYMDSTTDFGDPSKSTGALSAENSQVGTIMQQLPDTWEKLVNSPRFLEACDRTGVVVEDLYPDGNLDGSRSAYDLRRLELMERRRRKELFAVIKAREQVIIEKEKSKDKGTTEDWLAEMRMMNEIRLKQMREDSKKRLEADQRRTELELSLKLALEARQAEIKVEQERREQEQKLREEKKKHDFIRRQAELRATRQKAEEEKRQKEEAELAEQQRKDEERLRKEEERQFMDMQKEKERQRRLLEVEADRRMKMQKHGERMANILQDQRQGILNRQQEKELKVLRRRAEVRSDQREKIKDSISKRVMIEQRIQCAMEEQDKEAVEIQLDFDKKAKLNEQRRMQHESMRMEQLKLKKQLIMQKEMRREELFAEAEAMEERRKEELANKHMQAQMHIEALEVARHDEMKTRQQIMKLADTEKAHSVERMRRAEDFRKMKQLEKMNLANQRVDFLVNEKRTIVAERTKNAVVAAIEKAKVKEALNDRNFHKNPMYKGLLNPAQSLPTGRKSSRGGPLHMAGSASVPAMLAGIDIDGDGYIEEEEVRAKLEEQRGGPVSDAEVKAIMKPMDFDGDGKIAMTFSGGQGKKKREATPGISAPGGSFVTQAEMA